MAAKKKKKVGKRKDRPDEEIKKLAQDAIFGQLFCSDQIPESQLGQMLRMVFMVLAFMDKKAIKQMEKEDIVAFYEYNNKAIPGRAINGFPIFMSCGSLTRTEYAKFRQYEKDMREAMKKAVGINPVGEIPLETPRPVKYAPHGPPRKGSKK
jgi:hypothetical protein